jgi:hypothetical protein
MYEQGEPSERIPVVDLSSDEEDIFPDISCDEEFVRKLFGDLNYGLLGPPGDGNVIILINSDEEKEVREEDTADTEAAPPSVINSLAPTVSTANAVDALDGVQDDSNGSRTPDRVQNDSSDGGDEAGSP